MEKGWNWNRFCWGIFCLLFLSGWFWEIKISSLPIWFKTVKVPANRLIPEEIDLSNVELVENISLISDIHGERKLTGPPQFMTVGYTEGQDSPVLKRYLSRISLVRIVEKPAVVEVMNIETPVKIFLPPQRVSIVLYSQPWLMRGYIKDILAWNKNVQQFTVRVWYTGQSIAFLGTLVIAMLAGATAYLINQIGYYIHFGVSRLIGKKMSRRRLVIEGQNGKVTAASLSPADPPDE